MSLKSTVGRIRRPEYTGANRCTPCTFVNAVIAVAVAGASALLALSLSGRATTAALVSICLLAVFAAAIYLRGYLLPGTPALTKRYLPDRVLRWFGHRADAPVLDANDVEAYLTRVGAVQPCSSGDDLCLTPEFRSKWRAAVESVQRDGDLRHELADRFGFSHDQLDWMRDDGTVAVWAQHRKIGEWESETALLADVAAWRELAARDDEWQTRQFDRRQELLRSLRVFLDECPSCRGPLELREETVETCCSTVDLHEVVCADCAERLLTADASGL